MTTPKCTCINLPAGQPHCVTCPSWAPGCLSSGAPAARPERAWTTVSVREAFDMAAQRVDMANALAERLAPYAAENTQDVSPLHTLERLLRELGDWRTGAQVMRGYMRLPIDGEGEDLRERLRREERMRNALRPIARDGEAASAFWMEEVLERVLAEHRALLEQVKQRRTTSGRTHAAACVLFPDHVGFCRDADRQIVEER